MDAEVGAPLENGEGIMVLDHEGAHYVTDALISNELYRSRVFAPEINWYLKQTQAEQEEKKEVLKKLYEMRFIRYTHAPKKKHSVTINRTVMVIGQGEKALDFVQKAERLFDVVHVLPSKLLHLEGTFGGFSARILQEIEEEGVTQEHEVEVRCAQLVMCDQRDDWSKHRGVECVMEDTDKEVVLMRIRNRIGFYEYTKAIRYDATQCAYYHNDASAPALCAQICPSFGIVSDEGVQELHLSALDCTACGKCVSVCPTGALDFAPFLKKAFLEAAQVCEHQDIFLVSESSLESLEGCEIPCGYIPFVVESEQFLGAVHIDILLKQGVQNIVCYAPQLSDATQNAWKPYNTLSLFRSKEALQAHFAFTCKDPNDDTQRNIHG